MSENKALHILVCAREILSDPDHWTKGTLARTKTNKMTTTSNPAACRYCSMGAIVKCSGNIYEENDATIILEEAIGGNIIAFNDNVRTTHDDLMKMWDKAIRIAKEKAGG